MTRLETHDRRIFGYYPAGDRNIPIQVDANGKLVIVVQ